MANRANHIFPECYVDTNIMKTILHVDGVNHHHSCTKIVSDMEKGRFADTFAIGIIDDDKKKPSGVLKFEKLEQIGHLTLMKHPKKHHYLIVVSKAAEDFMLACAEEAGLKMEDFDLPSSLEQLKEVTKDSESDCEPRVTRLIKAVRRLSEMERLERTLRYLQQYQYSTNLAELVSVFRG